jgi:hypothetical protein
VARGLDELTGRSSRAQPGLRSSDDRKVSTNISLMSDLGTISAYRRDRVCRTGPMSFRSALASRELPCMLRSGATRRPGGAGIGGVALQAVRPKHGMPLGRADLRFLSPRDTPRVRYDRSMSHDARQGRSSDTQAPRCGFCGRDIAEVGRGVGSGRLADGIYCNLDCYAMAFPMRVAEAGRKARRRPH